MTREIPLNLELVGADPGRGGATVYDIDILQWPEHQAELLRRVAAGEAVAETPD